MPFHGVRSPLGRDDLEMRCRAYALRMRADAAFTSVTAALLWNLPLPAWAEPAKLDVSVPHGAPRPRSRGVIGTERHADIEVVSLGGLPVLSPAETWASLGAHLGVPDLVAVADHLLGSDRREPMATIEALSTIAMRRARGVPRLRRALPWIRAGSASRPESLVRVLLTASRIPEPRLNWRVPGLRYAIDLAWPEAAFGVEYQGQHHLAQRDADIQRQELVHDEGLLLMEVTKLDLFDAPAATVARVARRLTDRGLRVRATNPPKWALPRR